VRAVGTPPQLLHQYTCEPVTKLVPVTTIDRSVLLPTMALGGDTEAAVGLPTVSDEAPEYWPRETDVPFGGFCTSTTIAPTAASELDGTVTVNCVLLVCVGVSRAPFGGSRVTIEPVTKLFPFTTKVRFGLPIPTVLGLTLLMVGARIVNVCRFEVTLLASTTAMLAVPAVISKAVVTVAVICVAAIGPTIVRGVGEPPEGVH
jgi:hypothetical protein